MPPYRERPPTKVKPKKTAVAVLKHVSHVPKPAPAPAPARSQSRPPQQVVRQRAVKQAAKPAQRVLKAKQQKAVREAPKAVRGAQRTLARVEAKQASLARQRATLSHHAREPLPSSYNAKVARDVQLAKSGSPYHDGLLPPPRQRVPDPSKVSHLIDLPKVAKDIKKRAFSRNSAALTGSAMQGASSGISVPGVPMATVKVQGHPERVGRFAQNAVKDAIDLPVNAPASVYLTAHAVAKAATGDTRELKALGNSLKNHDPIVLAAQGRLKEAGHEAFQHPVSTALELSGAKAVVGRAAGAGLRTAGRVGLKSAAKAGSTERAPLRLYGHVKGGPEEPRTYSRDSINKLVQVAGERAARKRGQDPNVVRAGSHAQKRLLSKQMNEDIALTEARRRTGKHDATREVAAATRGGKVATKVVKVKPRISKRAKAFHAKHHVSGLKPHHVDAAALAVERVLTHPDHVVRDLKRYEAKLKQTDVTKLSKEELRLHEQSLAQVQGLLNNKEFLASPHPAFESARKVIASEQPRTKTLLDTKMLDPTERAAKYVPYAIVHMDAKPALRVTESGDTRSVRVPTDRYSAHLSHQQAEATAARQVRRAERVVQTAKRREMHARGSAEVRVGQADRQLLRRDKGYRQAAAALSKTTKELSDARKAFGNAARNPKLYTEKQLAQTLARARNAQKAQADARAVYDDVKVRLSKPVVRPSPDAQVLAPPEDVALAKEIEAQARAMRADAKNQRATGNFKLGAANEVHLDRIATQFEARAHKLRHVRPTVGQGPVGSLKRLERKRGDVQTAEQALVKARADHAAAREARIASRVPKTDRSHVPLLLDKNGKPLTVDAIKAHMAAHGVEEPGFFSQRPGATGRSSFYTAMLGRNTKRPAMYSRRRTGLSTAQGTNEANREALVAQGAHSANMAEAAKGFDRTVSHFSISRPVVNGKQIVGKGHWKTYQAAQEAGVEMSDKVGVDLVPINVGRTQAIKDLLDAGQVGDQALEGLSGKVHEAFKPSTQAGEYLLVPKMLKEKLTASVAPRAKWEQAVQEYTRIFKSTVLASSVRWLFGNVSDLTLRSLNEGLTPLDVARGHQVLSHLEKVDPEAAALLRERVGGNFFHAQEGMETYRAKGRVARLLPSRVVSGIWNTQKKAVYGANSAMERNFNYAALGKHARMNVDRSVKDLQGFFKVGERGLHDYIAGLHDTTSQLAATRFVERVFGRWGKLGPETKRFMIHTPFLQWLGVATRYVYVTLPAHHPIKVAALSMLSDATEKEREAMGFKIDPFKVSGKQLRDYLQGGVPSPGGKVVPLGRYTSLGIMGGGFTGLGDFLIPQFKSSLDVLTQGIDFAGNKIKHADGRDLSDFDRVMLASYVLGEGTVPWLSYARRLQEHGQSSRPTSTVVSPKTFNAGGDLQAALDKVFNPLHPAAAKFNGATRAKVSHKRSGGYAAGHKISHPGGYAAGGGTTSGSGGYAAGK